MLSTVKVWFAKTFDMKDLGEANYNLGVKLYRDRKNRMIGLSQAAYIDKVLVWFVVQNSKKGITPIMHGVHLSKDQCPKTTEEKEQMKAVPFAFTVCSLIYAMLCTGLDIYHAMCLVGKYQSNSGPDHWTVVTCNLKCLRRTRDYTLICGSDELISVGYTDSDFM